MFNILLGIDYGIVVVIMPLMSIIHDLECEDNIMVFCGDELGPESRHRVVIELYFLK